MIQRKQRSLVYFVLCVRPCGRLHDNSGEYEPIESVAKAIKETKISCLSDCNGLHNAQFHFSFYTIIYALTGFHTKKLTRISYLYVRPRV